MSDGETATTNAIVPPDSNSIGRQQPTPNKHSFPAREDCWSEAATHALIEEWGSHYLRLNRGNLTQKHWQEIADTINDRHVSNQPRTDIQCKNRIDTVKKKYKIEKSRVLESDGKYLSTWSFFQALDSLIGFNFTYDIKHSSPRPAAAVARQKAPLILPPIPSSVPVGPRSKRRIPDVAVFRRNFPAMAAAAAAVETSEQRGESETGDFKVRKGSGDGYVGALAAAIERLGKIYERVEVAKQKQVLELEKQRMQFAKDLEVQRMKWFVDSQLQVHKVKRSKHHKFQPGS